MKGFSLMEVVIVVGIMAFLTALLVGYNRASDSQLILSVEQAQVVGLLNRAKAFALERNLARGGENACAFGVNFSKAGAAMTLFRAMPADGANCANGFGTALGDPGTSVLEAVELDKRLKFQSFSCEVPSTCVDKYDVAFEPPYLATHNWGSVVLGVKSGDATLAVDVGVGGEITAH